jgi:hypothetical protein
MFEKINTLLPRVQRRLPVSDIGAYVPTRSASGDR